MLESSGLKLLKLKDNGAAKGMISKNKMLIIKREDGLVIGDW